MGNRTQLPTALSDLADRRHLLTLEQLQTVVEDHEGRIAAIDGGGDSGATPPTAGTAAASKALVLNSAKDATGIHKLGFTQEVEHAFVTRQTLSVDTTLAETNVGQIIDVDTDAKVLTLPATVVGMRYRIRNAGADGGVLVTVSPNASDKIMGCGITSADDKDLLNTKATAKKGDYIDLLGDGVNGWYIQELRGTWARQA
jgi:hypothetical protein